jgi:hypothetical protein
MNNVKCTRRPLKQNGYEISSEAILKFKIRNIPLSDVSKMDIAFLSAEI